MDAPSRLLDTHHTTLAMRCPPGHTSRWLWEDEQCLQPRLPEQVLRERWAKDEQCRSHKHLIQALNLDRQNSFPRQPNNVRSEGEELYGKEDIPKEVNSAKLVGQ